jgi:hypothetical protein
MQLFTGRSLFTPNGAKSASLEKTFLRADCSRKSPWRLRSCTVKRLSLSLRAALTFPLESATICVEEVCL